MTYLKLHSAIIAILFTSTLFAGDRRIDAKRNWKDNTGNFNVVGTLVGVNSEQQSVTLQLRDGDTITLPIRRLSTKDQKFVNAWSTPVTANSDPVKLAGIHWFQDLEDAQQAATGKTGPADDKPIMCFRALGELSGFM